MNSQERHKTGYYFRRSNKKVNSGYEKTEANEMNEMNEKLKTKKNVQEELDHRRAELLYMGWYMALLEFNKKNGTQFIVNNTCL